MKDRVVIIPKEEIKLTISQRVLSLLGNKTMTSDQVWKTIGDKNLTHMRAQLPNMVREGLLERVHCDKCNVGVMYRVKK